MRSARGDGGADPLDRGLHVAEQERVMPRQLALEEGAGGGGVVVDRGGRARSRSSRSRPTPRPAPRRAPSRTVGSSNGRPASPSRRYGDRRTVFARQAGFGRSRILAARRPPAAGHTPEGARFAAADPLHGSASDVSRTPVLGGSAFPALAHDLQHDLDPQHHDRGRGADHADGDGREERHLLEEYFVTAAATSQIATTARIIRAMRRRSFMCGG